MKLRKIMNNFYQLITPKFDLFFSYETPIAMINEEGHVYLSDNEWSVTTGKHINHIKNSYSIKAQIPNHDLRELIKLEA